jgi:hypothetical protein
VCCFGGRLGGSGSVLLGRGLGGRFSRSTLRVGPRGRIGDLCFRDWGQGRLGIVVRGLLRT